MRQATIEIPADDYAQTLARLEGLGVQVRAVERRTQPRDVYILHVAQTPVRPRTKGRRIATVVCAVVLALAAWPMTAGGVVTLAEHQDACSGTHGAFVAGIAWDRPATGNLFPLETRGGVDGSAPLFV